MNNFEGIVALCVPIISTISLCTMFIIFRSYLYKERMAMIERGMNPADLSLWLRLNRSPYRWMRFACMVVGVGVGLFLGNVLRATHIDVFNRGGIVAGLTFICGGLGMLTGFFIQYGLKKESRDKGFLDHDTEGGII